MQFCGPPDEQRACAFFHSDAVATPRDVRLPDRDGIDFPFDGDGVAFAELDGSTGGQIGPLVDHYASGRGVRLEAGGSVHDVAHHGNPVGMWLELYERLPGGDRCPHFE